MAGAHPILCGRVVGALACQRNSYLRTLETDVISCVKRTLLAADQNGPKKKCKAAAESAEASASPDMWLIECADSVLFPEGGGQPSDHGTIMLLSGPSAETIPIKYVQRHGLRCLLHSPRPLSPGDRVRQEVDFQRRWDHMQQHTGQHLLSAIMDTYDNLKTLGWGMGGDGGDVNYVDLPRKPSQEEIQAIQDRCNENIRANLSIGVETPGNAKDESLPDDYDKTKGVVRVVSIGGLDRNTCCGTHLSQTSHISLILLLSTQSVHGKNCRLYFTAGDRAINLSATSIGAVRSIAKLMACGNTPDEMIANVKKMRETVAELTKKEKKLLSEIAKHEGDRVKPILQTGKRAWVYRANGGLEFINGVVSEVKDAVKECSGIVVLASGEEKMTGQVVIVGEKNAVDTIVAKVKEVVSGIKGGGKGEKWQGKVTEWFPGELEALKKLVES